jgi:acetate kinase
VNEAIAVFNAGSTSLKFAAYSVNGQSALTLITHGQIEDMETDPQFIAKDAGGETLSVHAWEKGREIGHRDAFHFVGAWLEKSMAGAKVVGAGHRVVLGGTRFERPVLIDADVLAYLDSLVVMEPSHQAYNLSGARALAEAFPDLPQVACFDTSFHRTMPEVAQIYALPNDVLDDGARHWGFHGISYEYISRQVPKYAPEARRVIAAHLGGGTSMCAMLDGKSVETTMGFGGLSGLPMATRSGDVPQDLLFYLLRTKKFDDVTLEKMLYERSGMLGLSGISEDMRVLQTSADPRAAAAITFFVYAMTKYVGAYTSVLGGLDALVFTAGIGENSAVVRAGLCRALAWLGVQLDDAANMKNGPRISTADSKVSVWVIPTDEDLMIARHTLDLIRPLRQALKTTNEAQPLHIGSGVESALSPR